jgi:hypothetical protein
MPVIPVCIELQQQYLYCPVTGTLISDGENEVNPSPATLFIYLYEIDDFQYVRPDIQEIIDRIEESIDEDDETNLYDVLINKELSESESLLLLSLTYCGFGCGPIATTVDYCFDMNYSAE